MSLTRTSSWLTLVLVSVIVPDRSLTTVCFVVKGLMGISHVTQTTEITDRISIVSAVTGSQYRPPSTVNTLAWVIFLCATGKSLPACIVIP